MKDSTKTAVKAASVAALAILLLFSMLQAPWNFDVDYDRTPSADIADSMFDDYGLAFMFISLILFSAMLGGMFLAKGRDREILEKVDYRGVPTTYIADHVDALSEGEGVESGEASGKESEEKEAKGGERE